MAPDASAARTDRAGDDLSPPVFQIVLPDDWCVNKLPSPPQLGDDRVFRAWTVESNKYINLRMKQLWEALSKIRMSSFLGAEFGSQTLLPTDSSAYTLPRDPPLDYERAWKAWMLESQRKNIGMMHQNWKALSKIPMSACLEPDFGVQTLLPADSSAYALLPDPQLDDELAWGLWMADSLMRKNVGMMHELARAISKIPSPTCSV